MDPIAITLVAALVVLGLMGAALARRRPAEAFSALGFERRGDVHVLARDGYTIEVRGALVVVPLAPRPLSYDRMVRALGRGDLLAELFSFGALATHDRLAGQWPHKRLRGLDRDLTRLLRLCRSLEALPLAEALSRHYLELGDGLDPVLELERLIASCPDAPETRAICHLELEVQRHPRLVALARLHLEVTQSTGDLSN